MSHIIEPKIHLLLETSSTKINKILNQNISSINLPIANGMMNKPTKMSLTARLTISIFDAVRSFRTRQTASMTTRFPNIVIVVMIEHIIIIITKYTGLRGSFKRSFEVFVVLINSSIGGDDNGSVACIRRRERLSSVGVVVPFIGEI
jgi:hypothetical protein